MTAFQRPASYQAARQAFREAAQRLGAQISTHPLPPRAEHEGHHYEIDVATRAGLSSTAPCLLISSGLHGVEGYAGSLAQTEFMSQLAHSPAALSSTRLILVHGLNPYGFQHHRRWNEAGVDLNRNFLEDPRAYSGCASAYRELNTFINPPSKPAALDDFWLKAPLALAKHGFAALNRAIAEGQYEFPQGLFFGGKAPSACKEWLDTQLFDWCGTAKSILHIDLHTGLGAYTETQLFLETACSAEAVSELRKAFHPRRFRSGEELVFIAPGALGRYLQSRIGEHLQSLTLEMGTCSPTKLFRLLRAENQAHHSLGFHDPRAARARDAVLQAFAPAESHWWRTVMPKVIRTLRDALELLDSKS